jgi:hypothetical protein
MSEYDSDIDFDFFDDLETDEAPPQADRPRARPPGGPPRRPHEGPQIPPTARLVGLIAFGILIIVLFVLWVQSCSGSSKKSSFDHYFGKVQPLAVDSNRLGQQFSEALTTPGIKAVALANKLDDLGQIKSPKELRDEHAAVSEALAFRVSGLHALADTLRTTSGTTNIATAALELAGEAQKLVASDVVWEDQFRQRSLTVLRQQGVTGLAPPASKFLKDSGVDSQAFWTPVLQRLNKATPTGAKIGTAIVGVKALPKNTPLSTTQLNTVTASTDLGFAVTVQNSGDVQVVQRHVTITLTTSPKPITLTQKIARLDPGQQTTVTFTNLPAVTYATQLTLKVDVETVTGETNASNNSYSYPIILSLG